MAKDEFNEELGYQINNGANYRGVSYNGLCSSAYYNDDTRVEYEKDENGRILSEKHYYDDKIEYELRPKYGENGQVESERIYGPDGKQNGLYSYTYNGQGQVLETRCERMGNSATTSFAYDESGRLISSSYDGGNGNTTKYSYQYDSNNRLALEERNADMDSAIYTTRYEENGHTINTIYDKKSQQPRTMTESDANGRDILYRYYTPDGEDYTDYVYEYDASGNALSKTKKDSYGMVHETTKWEYDEHGNFVTGKTYDARGNLLNQDAYVYAYEYNDAGEVVVENRYNSGTNLLDEKIIRSADGEIYKLVDYDYDEYGNVLCERTSYEHTDIYDKTLYEYDKAGRVIRKDEYQGCFGKDELECNSTTMYQYDANGNMEERKIDPITHKLIEKTNYDANGNVLISERYYNGELDQGVQYEYDEKGRLISMLTYDGNKDINFEQKYGYDEAGNLVSTKRYDANGNLVFNEVAKEMVFGGKTYTFNANELTSIVKSLDASKGILTSNLGSIGGKLVSIAGMIQGSGVSGAINKVVGSCSDATTAVDKYFSNLSADITDYVNKTVRNEEEVARNIQEINSEIDEISFSLDEIN